MPQIAGGALTALQTEVDYWFKGIVLNYSRRRKVQIALLKKCASFQQPPTLHKNTVSYIIILSELLLGWCFQITSDKPQWRIIIRHTNQSYSGVSFLQEKKPSQDFFMLSIDCYRFLSTEHYKTKGIVKWKEKQTLILSSKKSVFNWYQQSEGFILDILPLSRWTKCHSNVTAWTFSIVIGINSKPYKLLENT